jgi:hypothetical protein
MQNNHIIHANTAVIKDGTVLNDVYIEIVNGKISRLAASKDASCAARKLSFFNIRHFQY